MTKSLAPVDVSDFALTYPVNYGKPQRCAVVNSDRPWCGVMSAIALSAAGAALGGKTAAGYVRDVGTEAACMDAVQALSKLNDWDDRRRQAAWAQSIAGAGPIDADIPVRLDVMGKQLDPYQENDVRSRLTMAGVVLGYNVGLGKTITAISMAERLLIQAMRAWYNDANIVSTHPVNVRPDLRVVVVCPLNAMPVWKDPSVASWFEHTLRVNYSVVSADSLHKIQSICHNAPSVLIVDEAHYFGMWTAERTRLIHKLRFQFDACLTLTGSMLHAGPEKVLSILDLTCPGAALFGNKWEFGRAFECITEKRIGPITKKSVGKPLAKHAEAFQKYLNRFVIAKSKRSPDVMKSVMIPDQPVYTVKTGDCTKSVVQEASDMALAILADTKVLPSMQEVVHKLARVGIDDKIDWLESMMSDNDVPVVMFATYHDTLDAVEEWLKDSGIDYVRVDGAVTGAARGECLNAFSQGLVRVFLAQTDAASVSMNLQRANVSVMLDPGQKGAAFEQALGRTCRRGSTELCHHFNLAGNSFQAFVYNRLEASMDFNAQVSEWQDAKRAIEQLTLTQGAQP
jgi:hypothetical protein